MNKLETAKRCKEMLHSVMGLHIRLIDITLLESSDSGYVLFQLGSKLVFQISNNTLYMNGNKQ